MTEKAKLWFRCTRCRAWRPAAEILKGRCKWCADIEGDRNG